MARTSTSSATTSSTRSTSTTTATAEPTSRTSSGSTSFANPDTFLYNTGPITSLTSANWNRRQFYSVTRVDRRRTARAGPGLACPPCNIGPRSTPNYEALARPAVHTLPAARRCSPASAPTGSTSTSARSSISAPCGRSRTRRYAEPAADGAPGVERHQVLNVHSIAIQVPISSRATVDRAASRAGHRRVDHRQPAAGPAATTASSGEPSSRAREPGLPPGQPALQRGVVPMGKKDDWNPSRPVTTSSTRSDVAHPSSPACSPSCTRATSRTWRR